MEGVRQRTCRDAHPPLVSEAIFGVFSSSECARAFSHSKNTNFRRNSLNSQHAPPCGEQFGLAPRGVFSTSACWRKNARVDSKNLEKPRKSSPNRPEIDENRSSGPSSGDFGRENRSVGLSVCRSVGLSTPRVAPGSPPGRSGPSVAPPHSRFPSVVSLNPPSVFQL